MVYSLSSSRIGPGVHPEGKVSQKILSPEEDAKRLAAYAAVDEHVKDHHKVLGIGSVPLRILGLPFKLSLERELNGLSFVIVHG